MSLLMRLMDIKSVLPHDFYEGLSVDRGLTLLDKGHLQQTT